MNGSDPDSRGPLRFRRGPSCFWIINAPLFLAYCLLFIGFMSVSLYFGWREVGPYPWSNFTIVALFLSGAMLLGYLMGGLRLLYKWGKAFRLWSATFDRADQSITVRWGVFVPLRVREYHFSEGEALHVGRKTVHAYRNIYRLVYPVNLVLADGSHTPLLEYDDFFQARTMAEQAAAYASLSLIDASVEPPQVIAADKVGKPLRTAPPGVRTKPALSPPPGSRCRIEWQEHSAVIRLPLSGRTLVRGRSIKGLAVLALIVAVVGGCVWWATDDPHKTTTAVLGTLLFICLPMVSFYLLIWAFFRFRTTTITIDDDGVHYRTRALLFVSNRRFPHAELRSIRLDAGMLEILTSRTRLRFGEDLNAPEREWLCETLNKLATG